MAENLRREDVQISERRPLHCADRTSAASLEPYWPLGPMDHLVFPSVPIEVVFVYENPHASSALPSSSLDELLSTLRLEQALSRLLDYYPHLTGRLHFYPDSRAPGISRLGTGAELFVADCVLRLDDLAAPGRGNGRILMPSLPDCGNALTPPFDPTLEGVCRDPIFAVQRTRFACGGVALGVRLHHIVCDASGFFQLVRHLAEIYRKLATAQGPVLLSTPPEIRSFLRDPALLSNAERQAASAFRPSLFHLDESNGAGAGGPGPEAEAFEAGPIGPMPTGRVTGRVLRFTGPQLQELKERATDPRGSTGWVSTFEALSAYLYQRVYRARVQLMHDRGEVPASEIPACLSRGFFGSIELRGPTRLNLPEHYFPNAVAPLILSDPPHELLMDGPLWQVSAALHAVVRSFDPHHMEEELKWIAVQPDKSRIKVRFRFGGNFTVSQWSKHSMYCGMDFDADEGGNALAPVLVSPPLTDISRVDGLAFILSTEEELHRATQHEGSRQRSPPSLDVNLTLMEHLWPILAADEQFRQYCCGESPTQQ
ncbi:hypothetical protein ASPACDRAFT_22320 [Aspergillus aculeatus ATCC 16872]|uniref:Uncharacterized protein n=1 Tax=Aspergillus aculeatus (strain ATCC 16872 / CBS 172.66 / WB 5094) TaxID=690307 RepID=A0A1L9X5N8_ASPA1|nr:uncharacterized protein ASPACDRAFT_22320 [Aspergillus aculeatus ATCC 16872]OJK03618.1 hypothetical protein ASPACDRAFT_22320 [Aspergillus aculeatus ATCC 16872]